MVAQESSLSAADARPRVLIVENSVAFTGAFRSVLAAARQQRHAFEFRFVLPTGSANVAALRADGFAVDELPFVELGRAVKKLAAYGPLLLTNGWRLAQLVRRHRIDVLHSNDFYNLTPYVAQRLLGRRAPRVVTHVRMLPGSFPGKFYQFWCACAARYADRIVCVSDAVRRAAFAQEPKAVVVYDTLERHERHAPKTAYERPADAPARVVYLGNYIAGKGHLTALRGFAAAYEQSPALRLDFYGGTMGLDKNQQLRRDLETESVALGLGAAVRFHEFATDVEGLIKGYDVLLNCSEVESFSMVCFEALYYGVPLIATDCGGPRELFEDERSGYLVPVGDVTAVANRLLRLAADPAQCRAFAQAGRKFVEQKFGAADQSGAIWRF
ncbi:MAG: glycosyltransferase [Hymenobacteraceae bacterium]|nr:glycosyltransferase [Hymenobacteraceae bacterium]